MLWTCVRNNPPTRKSPWTISAEYVLAAGNDQVILCERGIRTFEPSTRYTLDVAAVPVALHETHLPVIRRRPRSPWRRTAR